MGREVEEDLGGWGGRGGFWETLGEGDEYDHKAFYEVLKDYIETLFRKKIIIKKYLRVNYLLLTQK